MILPLLALVAMQAPSLPSSPDPMPPRRPRASAPSPTTRTQPVPAGSEAETRYRACTDQVRANPEAARIGMEAAFVEAPDESYQVRRVLKRVF